MTKGLVGKLCCFTVQVLVSANDSLRSKFDMEVLVILLVLHTEANSVHARLFVVIFNHINMLINRLVFLKDVITCVVKPRL